MRRDEEIQAALDAWEAWRRCKAKSDTTMSFADCHDTAQAWVRFQSLYLGDDSKLAAVPTPSATILPFGGSA